MYVTAEQSTMSSTLLGMLPEELKSDLGEDAGEELFLGVFDESGHSNLGPSEDYALIDKFEKKALSVMKDRLNLTCSVKVLMDSRKGGKFGGGGCLGVIFAGVIVVGGLVSLGFAM